MRAFVKFDLMTYGSTSWNVWNCYSWFYSPHSILYFFPNCFLLPTAARALDILNFTPVNNKSIRIMYSHRDPSIRKSGTANIFIKVFILYDLFVSSILFFLLFLKVCACFLECLRGDLAGWVSFQHRGKFYILDWVKVSRLNQLAGVLHSIILHFWFGMQ